MASHTYGTTVRLTATITNTDTDALTDPTTLIFTATALETGEVEFTYTYPTHPQIVRSSAGVYYVDIVPEVAGRWAYRFEGTGAAVFTEQAMFFVTKLL